MCDQLPGQASGTGPKQSFEADSRQQRELSTLSITAWSSPVNHVKNDLTGVYVTQLLRFDGVPWKWHWPSYSLALHVRRRKQPNMGTARNPFTQFMVSYWSIHLHPWLRTMSIHDLISSSWIINKSWMDSWFRHSIWAREWPDTRGHTHKMPKKENVGEGRTEEDVIAAIPCKSALQLFDIKRWE